MLKLPAQILLTDGNEIESLNCSVTFERDFYWLNTKVGIFPIFEIDGLFYSGVSSIASMDSPNEPVFLSDETLSLIRLADES